MNISVIQHIESAGARKSLALEALAARNLQNKRSRMRREQRSRIAEFNLRPAPDAVRPVVQAAEIPVTFKAGPRKPRRVERPQQSTAPVEFVPVAASLVPKDVKDQCKAMEVTREWQRIGESGYAVRKPGAVRQYGKQK